MIAVIITIIVVIIIIVVRVSVINQDERQEALDHARRYTNGFLPTFTVHNFDSRYSFSIDEKNRKILYLIANSQERHLIDFENVISVEIIEDSNRTFSKSSLRTIGGGVVGGIVGGGAGAIIGGLSGTTHEKKNISKIAVRILLRNYSIPSLYIYCLNTDITSMGEALSSEHPYCIDATREAREIADHLSVIIDMMDREYQHQENMLISEPKNQSVADELEKLYSLKEKGLLSEEEFQKQKERLLS